MTNNPPLDIVTENTAEAQPHRKPGLIVRTIISLLVVAVLGSIVSFVAYKISTGVDNGFLEILLLIVLYAVGLVIGLIARLALGVFTLIDLLLFLMFSVTAVIIGVPYVASFLG